ncbi:MAG: hypothetical protein ACI9DC_003771 [Gammaproteobacteria bacterium]|jgi:hypothetical protein
MLRCAVGNVLFYRAVQCGLIGQKVGQHPVMCRFETDEHGKSLRIYTFVDAIDVERVLSVQVKGAQ